MRKFKVILGAIWLIIIVVGCDNPQKEIKKTPYQIDVKQENDCKSKGKLNSENITLGSFKYTYSELNDGTIWINRISFVNTKNVKLLKIPSIINGRNVTVLGCAHGTDVYEDSEDDIDYESNIFGICQDESFGKRYPKNIYKNTKKIEQIILPSTIKIIGRDTFMYLPQYKTLDISGCAAKNIDLIVGDYSWFKIKVSKSNSKFKTGKNMLLSKNGKELVKTFGKCNKLSIPSGVKSIKGNAFLSIKTNKLFIPSSVIEFKKDRVVHNYIKSVSVSKNNKVFGKLKNSLYKKKNMELIMLCNKEREIIIPEGIKIVKDFCYNMISVNEYGYGKSIKKIEFPKSIKKFDYSLYFYESATLVFKSKKCPKLHYSFLSDSKNGSSKFKIYVPHGCKREYKKVLKDYIGSKDKVIVC